MARQWKGGAGLDLLRHARDGAVKLVQSLPAEVRDRILIQAEPIPDESNLGPLPRGRKLVYDLILRSLSLRLQIRIWYRDTASGTQEATKLSVYRLVLARGTWFAVGRSTFHRQVCAFRIPRIERAAPTDDPYTIPPRFSLERVLGMAWEMERGKDRYEVWLRFGASVAPEIRETHWHRSQRLVELPDERTDLYLVIDGLDEIVGWILGFGDEVEVLAPAELRERIRGIADRIAQIHAPESPAGIATLPR
jgi:proteasome accessory factor B